MDKKIVEKYPCKDCLLITICQYACPQVIESIKEGHLRSFTGDNCPFCGEDIEEILLGEQRVMKCRICRYKLLFRRDKLWTRK